MLKKHPENIIKSKFLFFILMQSGSVIGISQALVSRIDWIYFS